MLFWIDNFSSSNFYFLGLIVYVLCLFLFSIIIILYLRRKNGVPWVAYISASPVGKRSQVKGEPLI